MKKKQYIVQISGINNREYFFEYINDNYKLKNYFTKDYMIHSKFPFVIDFKDKSFWVCESITCCACAAQNNKILSFFQFQKKINNML